MFYLEDRSPYCFFLFGYRLKISNLLATTTFHFATLIINSTGHARDIKYCLYVVRNVKFSALATYKTVYVSFAVRPLLQEFLSLTKRSGDDYYPTIYQPSTEYPRNRRGDNEYVRVRNK